MAIEVSSDKVICSKCGTAFVKRKGHFPVSYAELHKGSGYIPICRHCIDALYGKYLAQCNDSRKAVRQVCRKLDLYWSDGIFDNVERQSSTRSLMTQYITKLNNVSCAGKSYDDTLLEEGTLWKFDSLSNSNQADAHSKAITDTADTKTFNISDDVIAFWGTGYSNEMYEQLEQRREYYMSKFPQAFRQDSGADIGSDILMRQLCNLEVSISKDSAAGKSIDKSVNALNTLIGSLNMKPAQRKNDDLEAELSSTPFGVWLYRFEHKRPLPEIDESLRDVNHVKKYVFTWLGHICKMLGVKNGYTKLYEEEINRLRVEKPEYADECDEDLIYDAYSESPEIDGDGYD